MATTPPSKSVVDPKKILVILTMGSQSHHIVFSALYNKLLERGHSVTIISGRAQETKHPNLREIVVNDPFHPFLRKYEPPFERRTLELERREACCLPSVLRDMHC